ncbi:MAG: DMT family transporter [Candidatus Micrarchaeota archaeon]
MEIPKSPALLILLACAVWGLTFPLTDYALHFFDPFFILSLRFLIALLILGGYLLFTGRFTFSAAELKIGLLVGAVLFLTFATQIVGQKTVSPTSSALITGLYVIFVPLLAGLVQARTPSWRLLTCALLAFLGLFLLSGAQLSMGIGEWLTVICAVFASVHILMLSKCGHMDSTRLAFLQVGTCALMSVLAIPALGAIPVELPLQPLLAIGFMGVFASAFAYWAQTTAQKSLPAEKVAVFFLFEPMFAALFGWLFFGVLLAPLQWAGGALILLGMWGVQTDRSALLSSARLESKESLHP